MNNGQFFNYSNINRLQYGATTSKRKLSMSPVILNDRFTANNLYSKYANNINNINPINYMNETNPQYPNYFTNYNTSNNYHINASQQNIYYEKNDPRYNRYLYPEDNNIQNNYYIDDNRGMNRKLIDEAKEKLRSISNENNLKKKKKNNCVKLDIINCETQYPIMTCLNADPYNKLKKKSFIQNYNNINNYIINSNTKSNDDLNETNQDKMNSIQSESLFNNRFLKYKNNEFNNSCYNFRITNNIKKSDIINNNDYNKNSDISYGIEKKNYNNTVSKSKLRETILNMNNLYQEKLSKVNKYSNNNNFVKDNKLDNESRKEDEEKIFVNKIKKFIGNIEQYFITSFQKLYHYFLSQMMLFIQEKVYRNKNLLLKRFQRARISRTTDNSTNNGTPDKIRKLDSSYNDINKIYIPKKTFKQIKPIKNKINNINIVSSHNNLNMNSNTNTINYLNTDYNIKINETPFPKRTIIRNNNSVDKLRNRGQNFFNKNRSQDNLFLRKNQSPSIPVYSKTKFNLKSNINNKINNNRIIYTKKRTNKFNISKKYITEEILNNYFPNNNSFQNYQNVNLINSKNNLKNNPYSFVIVYGTKSPNNNKFKANERYNNKYNNIDNEENEDTIEQTIIKDICTYDKKFSVFIKYVTSQRYEQSYLRLKIIKHKNLYLNHKLDYIGRTHTDSITLKAIYKNRNFSMNEISEEKDSLYLSNIQDDENAINKIINMINTMEYFYKKKIFYYYNIFFNSLKYISNLTDTNKTKGRNRNNNNNFIKSKTYFNWKNKDIFINTDINLRKKINIVDLINNTFKKSNSVKGTNKENKLNSYFDHGEINPKIEKLEI